MQHKRKYIAVIVCMLLCVLLPLTAIAHPGRTDSQGGHYDRQNGGYHYHHGYPAHDHPGGVCPFEDVEEEDDFDVPAHDDGDNDGYDYAYENETTIQKQVMKSDSSDNSDFMHSIGIIVLLLSPFIIGGIIIHLRLRKKYAPIEIRSSRQKEYCRLDAFALLLPMFAILAAIVLILVLLYFS